MNNQLITLLIYNTIKSLLYSTFFIEILGIKKHERKKKKIIIHLIFLFSFIALSFFNYIFSNLYLLSLILYELTVCLISFYLMDGTDIKTMKKILMAISFSLYMNLFAVLSEEIVIYTKVLILGRVDGQFGTVEKTISLVILYIFLKLFRRISFMREKSMIPNSYLSLTLLIPFFTQVLIFLFSKVHPYKSENRYIAFISLLIPMLILFINLILNKILASHWIIILNSRKAIESYVYFFQLEAEKNDRWLDMKHDFKLFNQANLLLLKAGEVNTVIKEIEKHLNFYNADKNFANTGLYFIDSIINAKIMEAKKLGITIETNCKVHNQENDINIDIYDFIYLVGNLIDNAINATIKLKDLTEEIFPIKVHLSIAFGKMFLSIVNSYDEKSIESVHSLKEEHRGLNIVTDIVDSYNGKMNVACEGDVYTVKIHLSLLNM